MTIVLQKFKSKIQIYRGSKMLNILMATNNNNMIKFFINNILVKNDKARLYKITNNIEQTTEVLNNNDIDIIILDLRILQNNITSMFDMIKKKEWINIKNLQKI